MASIGGTALFPRGRERLVRFGCRLCPRGPQSSTVSRATLRIAARRPLAQPSAPSSIDAPSPMPAKWAGLRCTEVDARGGTTTRYISFDKSELTTRYGLMPRDVRKLATSSNSHIRIRPSTVLLHIFHLKVLVQRDRVLVFDDATSVASRAAFVRELRERMRHRDTAHDAEAAAVRQASYGQQRLPFEFHALEAVLSFVVSELERELAAVHLSTELVLRSLEDDIDRRTLITLLSLSSKVVRFARQAELVRDAVEEVLDRDDRVAALYLTAKTAAADDLTVAERLLGSYYIAYNGIVHDAQNLVASAMLDSNRNTMMLLDLKFRIGTLGLATGSLCSAFYAMNISNYIREYMAAFPSVSGTSAMLGVALLCYVSVLLRKLVRVKMMMGHGATTAAAPRDNSG
ncbi:hypothetical protein BT67DRAFT_448910 [Trichocladium antarcticum]|uniref:Magnesium transporter n=1 Tax=Trichocladium antarcticum TaxID=1450529 RepID=A0AAN6ZEE1_9PEZI|nr:hypothetical protein BT67DRAFT_448910 [Trichocladium antarcticum]